MKMEIQLVSIFHIRSATLCPHVLVPVPVPLQNIIRPPVLHDDSFYFLEHLSPLPDSNFLLVRKQALELINHSDLIVRTVLNEEMVNGHPEERGEDAMDRQNLTHPFIRLNTTFFLLIAFSQQKLLEELRGLG